MTATPAAMASASRRRRSEYIEMKPTDSISMYSERRRHDRHACISVARPGAVADQAVIEREVARRVIKGIGHQHQVAEPTGERMPQQFFELHFAIHVRIDEQERLIAEQRARLREAARGLERLRLARVGDAQARAGAVADALDDSLGEERHVDHGLPAAARRHPLEATGHERL